MCTDIIIPVHNRRELLNRAIGSIFSQTVKNWNLFIVDDASTEYSSLYLQLDPRIHIIRLPANAGPSHARNLGAASGVCPYISFLDSDDYWHPRKLEKQILYFNEHPPIQWVHTDEKWIKNGTEIFPQKKHQKRSGKFMEQNFERCLISPSAVCFRRAFWENSGGFSTSFRVAEDYELWLRLNMDYPIGLVEEKLTVKTAGDWGQLSRSLEMDRKRVLALHRFYRNFRNHPDFPLLENSFFSRAEKKISILISGARKYHKYLRLREYQSWSKVFIRLRTKFN